MYFYYFFLTKIIKYKNYVSQDIKITLQDFNRDKIVKYVIISLRTLQFGGAMGNRKVLRN